MAFPIEEGLKHKLDKCRELSGFVFVAFPIEEGLKQLSAKILLVPVSIVFVAFPIEEGLKLGVALGGGGSDNGFCGFSNRRRIETDKSPSLPVMNDGVFVAFPIEEGLKLLPVSRSVVCPPLGFCGFSNRRRIETKKAGQPYSARQKGFCGFSNRRRIET